MTHVLELASRSRSRRRNPILCTSFLTNIVQSISVLVDDGLMRVLVTGFHAALAGSPEHAPWARAPATSPRSGTQTRRAGTGSQTPKVGSSLAFGRYYIEYMRLHTTQTRLSRGLDDRLTPTLCRSMGTMTPTTNQTRLYLQVPSPPLWEPDVSPCIPGPLLALLTGP